MNTPARSTGRRLSYIDWMRGLAILIMIEAHVLDAWTRPTDRQTLAFAVSAVLAGFAAPMFLFLAGVSVALAAGANQQKTGSIPLAARRVRRRGWEIFGLAYLFRFQAYILNPEAMLSGMPKVDILNIMGPSPAGSTGERPRRPRCRPWSRRSDGIRLESDQGPSRAAWKSGRIAVASPSGPVVLTVFLTGIGEGRVLSLTHGRPLDSVALFLPARRRACAGGRRHLDCVRVGPRLVPTRDRAGLG